MLKYEMRKRRKRRHDKEIIEGRGRNEIKYGTN